MKRSFFLFFFLNSLLVKAQVTDPMVTKWWFNTTSQYYNSILVDVEAVYYTATKVYVKSTGVPSYYTNGGSLFNATNQTNIFNIPRSQTVGTAATRTYLRDEGTVAVLLDGHVALSPCDGKSYNSAGVWHQIAYKFEGSDFDSNKGHSTPGGQYHHHINPAPLYSGYGSTVHSPLLGYAFDGYPIYGPYGYSTAMSSSSSIARIKTSWKVRNITTRTTLPSGATASSSGPTIALQALGKYFEDYEYSSGYGDLDQYNGRTCVTPDYPSGTYAYFVTLDASGNPEFPYIIGDYFYGVAQYNGNMGPSTGNSTVPNGSTQYTPTVLPIKLAMFRANVKDCTAHILWQTAMEENVHHFELEYSKEGYVFEKIASLSPNGAGAQYDYTHRSEAVENAYYRLKTIDKDGSFEYSSIIAVPLNCDNKKAILAYPNPATDVVSINVAGFEDSEEAAVLSNSAGQILQTLFLKNGTNQLSVSDLPNGTYFISLKNEDRKVKIIIQH